MVVHGARISWNGISFLLEKFSFFSRWVGDKSGKQVSQDESAISLGECKIFFPKINQKFVKTVKSLKIGRNLKIFPDFTPLVRGWYHVIPLCVCALSVIAWKFRGIKNFYGFAVNQGNQKKQRKNKMQLKTHSHTEKLRNFVPTALIFKILIWTKRIRLLDL